MSAEVKVLSTSTRTNLEALKHHMKKLGFKYFEESDGWVNFGTQLMISGEGVSPSKYISINISFVYFQADIDSFDLICKLPEVKQAVLDFYEAEGIANED